MANFIDFHHERVNQFQTRLPCLDYGLALLPHSCSNVLLFLANGIGVDGGGRELGVAHPFGQHVQRDAVHGGIDPKPVT